MGCYFPTSNAHRSSHARVHDASQDRQTEVFEPYLRDYLTTFAHQAIDSYQWKKHLHDYFHVARLRNDAPDLRFSASSRKAGASYGQTMVVACEDLFKQWIEANEDEIEKINRDTFKAMQPLQQIEFLSRLCQRDPPLEHWKLVALDKAYGLNDSENSEIVLKWIRLCVKAKWEPIIDKALKFVSSQGRLKYCRPVYKDLTAWPAAKNRARETYIQTRSSMHPITAEMIAKDLHMRHSTYT
ncbi:leukotriene A4 hydrolase, partial [Teladorsagia circumcincta]